MLLDTPTVILSLFAALCAGLIGSFALMRRMTIAGDVVSHISLPGIALALIFKLNPLIGGAATLFIGTLLIWRLEKKTSISSDTAIGVIFSAALALGVLLAPAQDLEDALFGGLKISSAAVIMGFLGAAIVLLFVWKFKDRLIITLFSQELSIGSGIAVNRINLFYLLAFSLTVLLGLNILGALLMGALIIVPAAASRQFTHRLKPFLAVSSFIAVLSVALGYFLVSRRPSLSLGPVIVLTASFIFILSLLKKKN